MSDNLDKNYGTSSNDRDWKNRASSEEVIWIRNARLHRFLTGGPRRGSRGSTKITKVKYCTHLRLFYKNSGVRHWHLLTLWGSLNFFCVLGVYGGKKFKKVIAISNFYVLRHPETEFRQNQVLDWPLFQQKFWFLEILIFFCH